LGKAEADRSQSHLGVKQVHSWSREAKDGKACQWKWPGQHLLSAWNCKLLGLDRQWGLAYIIAVTSHFGDQGPKSPKLKLAKLKIGHFGQNQQI